MKKESNVKPVNAVKPNINAHQFIIHQRMATIFNEWAKRYSENPDEFSNILDDNGNPVDDYGDNCAIYFSKLAAELDEAGTLLKSAL